MELSGFYDAKTEELKWQKFWEKEKIYAYDNKKKGYTIDTPPPTVSGQMHIGHAFSYSHGDFIARYRRMRYGNVFYPFGTDDNGLPTERLVEKLKNVKSTKMKRPDFIKLCMDTLKEIKPEFVRPWKELGISCDFDKSYSTIDEHCIRTSQLSFIDLFEKGRVYSEETPISWCVACQTAIAQAEFENIEMTSHFNDIVFKVHGKDVVIATTRPELLSACVALMAHPTDKRYKDIVGKFAKVPLFAHEVPIIADESVDIEKGTGIVMCCTFGDKVDIEWWRKHKLPLRVSIEPYGVMNELAGQYKGLKIKDARKKILEDLKASGLLIRQKDIVHPVNVHERCSTEIEFLKTKQWFIRILDKKEELIEAGNKIKWYPEHMKVRYEHWVQNLNWDWCISRQRHFGVPFPVWHCKQCSKVILASKTQLPVDPLKDKPAKKCACGSSNFEPEKDVMDTWATSSVTPQIIMNWAKDEKGFNLRFPMGLRMQAHDIIRTWAFYTIVKSVYSHGSIPWKEVMISGHALDARGEKMSKSKGNVVDPINVMKVYNADALRFWAASSRLGDDLPFLEKDMVTGKKTITKLWNAGKFCFEHLKDYKEGKVKLEAVDAWILSKLNRIIKDSTEYFEKYEYFKTKMDVENFFWHDFCDNYMEIVKDRLYSAEKRGAEAKRSAQYALYHVFLSLLKLIAPIMPHITESLYQSYYSEKEKEKSIHISKWPSAGITDEKSERLGEVAVYAVQSARKVKSEKKLSLKAPVKRLLIKTKITKAEFELIKADIQATTQAEKVEFESLPEKSEKEMESVVEI